MKTKLKSIIFLVLIVIIIFNIYLIISHFILTKKIPNLFGYSYMIVQSNSMLPTIEVGDIVIIKLNDKYKVGDIVTYQDDNTYVTHRVIEIKQDEIITKGDDNNISDAPVKKDLVVGVVKKIL